MVGQSQATWRALLAGRYATARAGSDDCPQCRSKEPCDNYFCLKCEAGGACPATFHPGGDHFQHPWVRIYNTSNELSLREEDLTRFMDRAKVEHMQKFIGNTKVIYKFFTPVTKATKSPHKKGRSNNQCQVCGHATTSFRAIPNLSDTPVCSITCLLDQAEAHPETGPVTLVLSPEDATMPPPRIKKDALESLANQAAVESIDNVPENEDQEDNEDQADEKEHQQSDAPSESGDSEDDQEEEQHQQSGERQRRRKQSRGSISRSDYSAEFRPQR